MNLNTGLIDNFCVDVCSDSDSGGIDLTVVETDLDSGIFEGTVFFTPFENSSGHTLRVSEGDTVTVEYKDTTLPSPYTQSDELDITSTAIIETTTADTSNFNTVLSYAMDSCIGFENAPAGTETVELLLNGSTYTHSGVADVNYNPYSWNPAIAEEFGVTPGQCLNIGFGTSTNGHDAGEYKVAAYDSSGSLIAYSTPLVLEQWTNRGPSLTVPDDITQTTTDPSGATVSFTATLTERGPLLEMYPTNLFCNISAIN